MSTVNGNDPEFQSWVKGLLHDGNVKNLCITFTKADGDEREMHCTLVDSDIPADQKPKGTGRATPASIMRVFDVDVQEWRSFKWESVKQVQFDVE